MVRISREVPKELSTARLANNAAEWWFQDSGMRKMALAVVCGWMGTANAGFDGALFSGLTANPEFFVGLGTTNVNDLGLIGGAQVLGGIPAMIPAAWVSDKWGRRIGIQIGCVGIIIGAIVQTFTQGHWRMLAGRMVLGFGSTFQSIAAPPYTAEVAHPRHRAEATALITTCYYVGAVIAAWTTFGALYIGGQWSWRLCVLLQVVPAAFNLILTLFVSESPRYLVAQGRAEEGLEVLAKYHANGDKDDELVRFEFEEIKQAIANEQEVGSYSDFFKTKGNRHRLAIVLFVGFGSQWAGNSIISYYLPAVLDTVGITNALQQTAFNGGLQIWNWIAAVAAGLVCGRVRRRTQWLASTAGMLVSFTIITACSATYAHTGSNSAGNAVLAFLFIFYGLYDMAWTALAQAYVMEVLPYKLRTKGLMLMVLVGYVSAFFSIYVNPIALAAIAWKYYIVYIAIEVFLLVYIWFVFPETGGRLLEEVAEIFDGPEVLPAVAQQQLGHQHDSGKPESDAGSDKGVAIHTGA